MLATRICFVYIRKATKTTGTRSKSTFYRKLSHLISEKVSNQTIHQDLPSFLQCLYQYSLSKAGNPAFTAFNSALHVGSTKLSKVLKTRSMRKTRPMQPFSIFLQVWRPNAKIQQGQVLRHNMVFSWPCRVWSLFRRFGIRFDCGC